MEWSWAATWDVRMGNCMLPLGECNQQLAAPSCQERRLLQGAGPAGIQPSSSWRVLFWAVSASPAGQAGVPGHCNLSPAVHPGTVETLVYGG